MYYTQPELPIDFVPVKRRVVRTVTSYLTKPLLHPDQLIEDCRGWLKTIKCDTLVGRGMSGAIAVPLLARHFGKHWAVVRKPKDETHSEYKIEGEIGERWLFVDDLLSTGNTLDQTVRTVEKEHHYNMTQRFPVEKRLPTSDPLPPPPEFVGALLYCCTPARYVSVEELSKYYLRDWARKKESKPEVRKEFVVSQPAVRIDDSFIAKDALNYMLMSDQAPPTNPFPPITAAELNAQMRPMPPPLKYRAYRSGQPTLRPGESLESVEARANAYGRTVMLPPFVTRRMP